MGGTIRLKVERYGAEALVSVTDTGIGIPSDQQAHLFERFFRARNAPVSGFGGLGLGLYICRQIVDLHGGAIRAEFPQDGGTRFVVSLPSGSSTPPAA
jgi:signal transduction histidine kinase